MKSKYPSLMITPTSIDRDTQYVLRGCFDPTVYLQSRVDHDGEATNSVRVFKSSPESVTLQIRTFGPVGESSRGKNRRVYSHFSSNRQNMLELAAEIIRIANMLPEA